MSQSVPAEWGSPGRRCRSTIGWPADRPVHIGRPAKGNRWHDKVVDEGPRRDRRECRHALVDGFRHAGRHWQSYRLACGLLVHEQLAEEIRLSHRYGCCNLCIGRSDCSPRSRFDSQLAGHAGGDGKPGGKFEIRMSHFALALLNRREEA